MSTSPAVYLQGARQVGKSTLARALGLARYVTLDDPASLVAASADPDAFVDSLPDGTVIDEVQRVPPLARAIKRSVDNRRRSGRLLLTGSASVMVVPELARELVGRVALLTLFPFTQGELRQKRDSFVRSIFASLPSGFSDPDNSYADLARRVFRGGYPATLLLEDSQLASYFTSYFSALLQRDMRDISAIRDLTDITRLAQILVQRAARLVNYSDLASVAAIPQTTLKRHVSLLKAMFIVSEIPAWFTNVERRFSKSPKLLLSDTGLACALQGLDLEYLQRDAREGSWLLENFVGVELIKQISLDLPTARLHHFRLHSGAEVDWVIEDGRRRIIGIEAKASASLGRSDLAGLTTLQSIAGDRFAGGVVLYCGQESYMAGERICVTPVSALWDWESAATA